MASGVVTRAAPPGTARQALPDQLRGLALLGIVLVNVPFLGISVNGFTPASLDGALDRVAAFAVVAFAQGKFYLLFAFLFGYGVPMIIGRTADGLRRYRRRLVGLAVIGLVHAVLFFVGDILLSYAVLGAVLLWFLPRSDRTALRGAAIAYAVALVVLVLLVVAAAFGEAGGSGAVPLSTGDTDRALAGGFGEAAGARAELLPGVLVFLGALNWAQALAMFLLGLVAGRHGLLADPARRPEWIRRALLAAALVGLPGGVAAGLLTAWPGAGDLRSTLAAAVGFATAPALTAGYVALAALATRSRVLGWFAPAGRVSLTCYVGESVVLAAVFGGWGLGLYGDHGAAVVVLIGLAAWLALDVLASAWLRRFRYGPLEWVLRAWSYRQIPALRR